MDDNLVLRGLLDAATYYRTLSDELYARAEAQPLQRDDLIRRANDADAYANEILRRADIIEAKKSR